MSTDSKSTGKSIVREYIEAILIALILAFFIRTFVVQAFKIPSGSMKPTLLVGDHILVNKFIYGIRNPLNGNIWISVNKPERKDIIVFRFPQDKELDYIKRVIGLPGDTIEIRDKQVYVNNQLLEVKSAVHLEPEILPSIRDNFGPVTVPENSYFVMGDNRDNSSDSRFWGFVEQKLVKGKAFMIYWSWNSKDFSVRWDRLGDLVH